MQAIVNMKHILAALHCVSSEETRYYLNGVCLEIQERRSFAVSTDGSVLFAAHHALADEKKRGAVTTPADPDNTLLGQFILTTASVTAIKLRRIIDPATVMTRIDATTVKLVCDGEDFYAKLIDGTFPDWRRIVPNDASESEAAGHFDSWDLNSHKLDQFWKCAKALDLGWGGSGNPFSIARNGIGPALIRFDGEPNAIGAIMPYRSSAKRGKRPAWV